MWFVSVSVVCWWSGVCPCNEKEEEEMPVVDGCTLVVRI
jgi:nicotinamide riboside transporter PnuC